MTRGQANVLLPVTRSLPDLTFFLRKKLTPTLSMRKYATAITNAVDIHSPPYLTSLFFFNIKKFH
jgi:hypothetical protein